ncbi:DNA cross-link repair 1A protein [Drosophila sulfurigaster albostrigata]|uniref:DNA cross-link repair 1A protein n=1 Tax=Drosophila sulfurigaster albostrigata TaxID=89887 RepID=UPI002D21A22F|nr:DNA cross-link repair 1A protein [Drosophila sulfurigaster albostrigata]
MAKANVGKLRIKSLNELQHISSADETLINSATDKTPENAKKAANRRAATTTKKKHIEKLEENAAENKNKTTVKRGAKKEPLPGQLRIDNFFKSCAKSYKVEKMNKKSKQGRKPTGCKRLFDNESELATETTVTTAGTGSDVEYKPQTKPCRKRTQPQRNAKAKCKATPCDIIDLCSDEEEIIIKQSPSCRAPETSPINENTGVLADLDPQQTEASSSMVVIPCRNLPNEESTNDASGKENMPLRRSRRRLPPYKLVEGTNFVVDGFQFGDIPGATHYFLSHYHADHYVGLTKKFAHPLYMSPITARLVRTFIPIAEQYLHEIDVDETITVDGIEITALEANHCPGAIMLLFKLSTGKCILHTGDFRASFEMESLPIFWNQPDIDLLYLDTTYLAESYDFCHQSESITRLCHLVSEFHEKHARKRILHVCGSYVIGKEKLWLALAKEFSLRIWTEPHRRKAIDCLNWPELQELLCDDPFEANLHVISMGKISYPQLDQYFKQYEGQYDMLLGIRPSGWEKNSKPSYGKRISVIGIEYSEHSSYKELERFVRFLKPKQVISTVPTGRDLSVTGNVPTKWYQYEGCGRMISISYQPSISSYFQSRLRLLQSKMAKRASMAVSPMNANQNKQGTSPAPSNEVIIQDAIDLIKNYLATHRED